MTKQGINAIEELTKKNSGLFILPNSLAYVFGREIPLSRDEEEVLSRLLKQGPALFLNGKVLTLESVISSTEAYFLLKKLVLFENPSITKIEMYKKILDFLEKYHQEFEKYKLRIKILINDGVPQLLFWDETGPFINRVPYDPKYDRGEPKYWYFDSIPVGVNVKISLLRDDLNCEISRPFPLVDVHHPAQSREAFNEFCVGFHALFSEGKSPVETAARYISSAKALLMSGWHPKEERKAPPEIKVLTEKMLKTPEYREIPITNTHIWKVWKEGAY